MYLAPFAVNKVDRLVSPAFTGTTSVMSSRAQARVRQMLSKIRESTLAKKSPSKAVRSVR